MRTLTWVTCTLKTGRALAAIVGASLLIAGCAGTPRIESADSTEVDLPPAAVAIAHTSVDLVRTLRYSANTAARVYAYVMLAAGRAYFSASDNPDGAAVDAAADMMTVFSSKPFVTETFDVLRRAYRADADAGDSVVADLVERERGDGYRESLQAVHQQGDGDWSWQPTGLQRMSFQHPGFGDVEHLVPGAGACDIPAPDLDLLETEGREMLAQLDLADAVDPEVIAWLGGPGSPTPAGIWLLLTTAVATAGNLSDEDAMRLLTAVGVAGNDAAISTWREKLEHDVARPETMWARWTGEETVLPRETPAHPSYPSGHSAFSAAAAAVIRDLVGAVPMRLTVQEEVGRPAETYVYADPAEAVAVVNASRVKAGFHYPHDTVMGERLGTCIGDATSSHIDDLLRIPG